MSRLHKSKFFMLISGLAQKNVFMKSTIVSELLTDFHYWKKKYNWSVSYIKKIDKNAPINGTKKTKYLKLISGDKLKCVMHQFFNTKFLNFRDQLQYFEHKYITC